jgi:soluble lytic murein transglycosylase-like protein
VTKAAWSDPPFARVSAAQKSLKWPVRIEWVLSPVKVDVGAEGGAKVVLRWLWRTFQRFAWWQQVAIVVAAPIVALNVLVAFFGNSIVSPLSPFFLEEKLDSLNAYAKHRAVCLFKGHPDLRAVALEAERRHRLPPGLMVAVLRVESEGRPHRISRAGAAGPAQLMPGTSQMLGVRDPFDSAQAVDGGARYLAQLLREKRTVELAVASYNAGPGAIGGSVPRTGETAVYVDRVMRAMKDERRTRRALR